jgi:ubiquinone/menaquinone biosynthesis C-methylase UbiE
MSSQEQPYILGTDVEELHRLGYQHRVWAQATFALWQRAGFTRGHTILDLGCGPGYDAIDLAHIVGEGGRVIAVDKSEMFLGFLRASVNQQWLNNVEIRLSDFHELRLEPASLDAAYGRWALGWVSNPGAIVEKIARALKPGGRFVSQEYFNWGALTVRPESDAHAKVVSACLESWNRSEGEINVGGQLPRIVSECGMKVTHLAPQSRLGRPRSLEWQWVTTFLHSYIPRLIRMGLLSEADYALWKSEWSALEKNPAAMCFCPQMVELIAEKA